jgi:hypothetical protein
MVAGCSAFSVNSSQHFLLLPLLQYDRPLKRFTFRYTGHLGRKYLSLKLRKAVNKLLKPQLFLHFC